MSTSVTNPSKKRFKKTALVYTLLSIFFFAFSRIYESFSFGETSTYMHYLYAVPLVGGILLLILFKIIPNLSDTQPQPLELSSCYSHGGCPFPEALLIYLDVPTAGSALYLY